MIGYEEAIELIGDAVSSLIKMDGVDKARVAVEVQGIQIEIAFGDWDDDEEEDDE